MILTYLLTYLFDNRSVLRHTFWSTRYSVCALSSFLAQLSSPFSVATAVYVILGKIDSANCSRAAEHLRARTARPPSQPRATFTPLTSLSDNIPSFRIYAEVWLPAFSAKNIGLWRVETHQSIIDEWSYGFMGLHYGPPHPWKETCHPLATISLSQNMSYIFFLTRDARATKIRSWKNKRKVGGNCRWNWVRWKRRSRKCRTKYSSWYSS